MDFQFWDNILNRLLTSGSTFLMDFLLWKQKISIDFQYRNLTKSLKESLIVSSSFKICRPKFQNLLFTICIHQNCIQFWMVKSLTLAWLVASCGVFKSPSFVKDFVYRLQNNVYFVKNFVPRVQVQNQNPIIFSPKSNTKMLDIRWLTWM